MNSHPPLPELQGKILLANPILREGTFHKSVILLAEHSQSEGAFGLVLNQPSGQNVGDLLKDPRFFDLQTVPVHFGGPVSREHLTFAAFWVREGRFDYAVRISAEEAMAYVNHPRTLVRAFIGYSGWSAEQLEGEIDQESWTILSADQKLLDLSHNASMWKNLMTEISPFHHILANAPEEIMAN